MYSDKGKKLDLNGPKNGEDGKALPTCHFCKKQFHSLQALGGHQTTHRKVINDIRKEHAVFMEGERSGQVRQRKQIGAQPQLPPPSATAPASFYVPLDANPCFWERYRRTGQRPAVVDYMGLGDQALGFYDSMHQPTTNGESED